MRQHPDTPMGPCLGKNPGANASRLTTIMSSSAISLWWVGIKHPANSLYPPIQLPFPAFRFRQAAADYTVLIVSLEEPRHA